MVTPSKQTAVEWETGSPKMLSLDARLLRLMLLICCRDPVIRASVLEVLSRRCHLATMLHVAFERQHI